jgi:uncharacterized protein
MICPVCKNSMLVIERDRIELDHCSNCGGIWFDSGELELLLSSLKITGADTFLKGILDSPEEKTNEHLRRCPICSRKMKKTVIGTNTKVMVDVCRRGDGLWFDGGELDTLLNQVGNNSNGSADGGRKLSAFLDDVFHARGADKQS